MQKEKGPSGPVVGRAKGGLIFLRKKAQRAHDIRPTISRLLNSGITSPKSIAAALNAQGIHTGSGRGTKWTVVQIARVLARIRGKT